MPRYRYRRARKPKRKLYKSKGFWFFVLFLAVSGSLFYLVFFSDLLKVKNIEVKGNQKLGADDIRSALLGEISQKILFFIPKNIFAINFDKLSYDISSKFPEIDKISLKINLPNTVSAEIIEKTPAGCWCLSAQAGTNSDCWYFDKYGVIYQKNSSCNNLLIIVSDKKPQLAKSIISENDLNSILSIYKDSINPSEIKNIFVSNEKIILESKIGWVAYFKPYDDIPGQIVNLKAILEQKVGESKKSQLNYIDLRFGNKVFYKFKETALPSPSPKK